MTTEEFSNEFDILLNSYSSKDQQSINVDEYEKSVFLTKAQEDLIISVYNGKNSTYESFEQTEEIRRYLSNIVKTIEATRYDNTSVQITSNSYLYDIPKDLWFITYEYAILNDSKLPCKQNINALVVPVTQDEFYRVYNNPFKGPSNKRVLRLDSDNNIIELISKYNIDKYVIRYISKPTPIILEDLTEDLSINGESKKTECILNTSLHRKILDRAVLLALTSKNKSIQQ